MTFSILSKFVSSLLYSVLVINFMNFSHTGKYILVVVLSINQRNGNDLKTDL